MKLDKDGKPIIPESQVQNSIVDYFVKLGYEVIRFNSGGGDMGSGRWIWFYTWFGAVGQKEHSGVPDVFVFGKGLSFWIEIKRKSGAKRKKQKDFVESIIKAGGQATFVDSLDEAINYERELQGLRNQSDVQTSVRVGRDEGLDKHSEEGQRVRSRSRSTRKANNKPE